ncbi:MAG: hypothetical protein LBP75_03405 [Planctomycetota bacterium]|jgi:hypothetical protein|nr:hypothetical protein [Planctomycetota bacterium]
MLYKMSRTLNWRFRIFFTYPFNLADFLAPNVDDWRISPAEMAAALPAAIIHNTSRFSGDTVEAVAASLAASPAKGGYLFSSGNFAGDHSLFAELFRPSPALQKMLDEQSRQIGGEYVAVGFRFQRLLNDELGEACATAVLPAAEREKLIARCLDHLREIHAENPDRRVLLATDSENFRAAAQALDYVYAAPGAIAHMGMEAKGKSVWRKLFLDFFLIARAKKVYVVADGQMRESGFPATAAAIGQVPLAIKRY